MSNSKPEWASVWTPLLQAAVKGGTEYNYRLGAKHFLERVHKEKGRKVPLGTAREIDEALCEYAWWVDGNWAGRGKWRLSMALCGRSSCGWRGGLWPGGTISGRPWRILLPIGR